MPPDAVLVHLASGIGNIVLATPLLIALGELGCAVDLLLDADYPATAELFQGWSAVREVKTGAGHLRSPAYRWVVPAVPPFYWRRFARLYRGVERCLRRPPDTLFYQDEQQYYLAFARALGYPEDRRPLCRLPIAPSQSYGVTARTLALAPGCKTGEMAAKRWPGFAELARRFEDVAIVGTPDDVSGLDFPTHARSFIGRLTLRETAELLASAGAVVANDSGLGHVAAAAGAPTILLFGPTPEGVLGTLPPNATVLRAGLPCEPCWLQARFAACERRIDCLASLRVEAVEREARLLLGLP